MSEETDCTGLGSEIGQLSPNNIHKNNDVLSSQEKQKLSGIHNVLMCIAQHMWVTNDPVNPDATEKV